MSWINPSSPTGAETPWPPVSSWSSGSSSPLPFPSSTGSDGFQANWWGSDPALGSMFGSSNPLSFFSGGPTSILSQLVNAVQQYANQLGQALLGTPANGTGASPGATFQNATLSSTGDPHLAVSGTKVNADGSTSTVSSHFDSMQGHADLFSTNNFGDRFRVSTTVTAPAANGATYNQTATATMNGGADSVVMSGDGTIGVSENGAALALAPGQTLTLQGGETVAEAADGSAVTIGENNGLGKTLSTTFTRNGNGGVDVNAQVSGGVTVGGALIAGGNTPASGQITR